MKIADYIYKVGEKVILINESAYSYIYIYI